MVLSYAEAMKQKTVSRPQPPSNQRNDKPANASNQTVGSIRNLPAELAQKPKVGTQGAWGKAKSAPSAPRDTTQAWGKPLAKKPSQYQAAVLSSPTQQAPPPMRPPKAASSSTSARKELSLLRPDAKQIKNGHKQQQQQQQPKKKKPKPQLKSMSIGDLIAPNQGKTKRKNEIQPHLQLQGFNANAPTAVVAPALNSASDFPALGSVGSQPKSILSKSTWGKAMPQSKSTPSAIASMSKEVTPSASGNGKPKKPKKKKPSPEPAVPDARSAAMFFQPKMDVPREGDEHKLLRLLEDRTVYQKKGRQRLHPRKKRFTALKKKVLQERLDKWHELHPEIKEGAGASCFVCLYNYVQREELEEEDEYTEILCNLREMAAKIGPTTDVYIPKDLEDRNIDYPSFVNFQSPKDAAAAESCWQGLTIGGSKLRAVLLEGPMDGSSGDWKDGILATESKARDLVDESESGATTIHLANILTEDDYDDDECLNESLADIRAVAENYGSVHSLEPSASKDGSVVVTIVGPRAVAQIIDGLLNTKIGGKKLTPSIASTSVSLSDAIKSVVVLENLLTDDDLEDEDCMEETLGDIRELAERYGAVDTLEVSGSLVKVTYDGPPSIAKKASEAMNGMKLAGSSVIATVQESRSANEIHLHNILTADDLEDEECLVESLDDIRNLASKHGTVRDVSVIKDGNDSSFVRVSFVEGQMAVTSALQDLEGKVVGGQIVTAVSPSFPTTFPDSRLISKVGAEGTEAKRKSKPSEDGSTSSKKARTEEPMYSGDKLIPERFAEAKRVPKIVNKPGPRPYAKIVNDERVRPLLVEMLGELMRLQKRAVDEGNTKAKRRLVLGLREVARGIRSHKVKMVVMANNLDEYGVIDDKLQEIIDLAHNEAVPLFFEFTKRALGKAVGKNIKIAVIGIQNAEGAHQPFKKLMPLASTL